MPLSHAEFIAFLDESGIVPRESLDALTKDGATIAVEAIPLAQSLVDAGRLTRFQAFEILHGRGPKLLLGNYLLLDKLGAGGMGLVFKAQHRRMKRTVALKILPPDVVQNADRRRRFQREVEAAAQLTHPHVVTAYDADEADGTSFLVMEFVDGSDLNRYVRHNGRCSLRQAIECALHAARGLEYAHRQGIVHRDIKPSNLLLDRRGVVRVLDLGLARSMLLEADATRGAASLDDLSETGRVLGTVDYMAPEQAVDAKHVDGRADIYSLGGVLFFLLAGRCATPDGSLAEKLLWHQAGPAPSIRYVRPEVSPELDRVCQTMMARKPADRYRDMAAAIVDLERCLAQAPDGTAETLLHEQRPAPAQDSSPAVGNLAAAQSMAASQETRTSPASDRRTVMETGRYSQAALAPAGIARHDRQMRYILGGVLGAGLCLAFLAWVVATAGKGKTSAAWDPAVRHIVEGILPKGVDCPAGRQLYSDVVTAVETQKDGDWWIGAGLTRDGKAHRVQLERGNLTTRILSLKEAASLDLPPQSTRRAIDSSFKMRALHEVTLESPQLRLETAPDGKRRVTGTVQRTIVGTHAKAKDLMLVLRSRVISGRRETTRDFYQHFDETRLESGPIAIDCDVGDAAGSFGPDVQLFMQGFLTEPSASFYRISNELPCTIAIAAENSPVGDQGSDVPGS